VRKGSHHTQESKDKIALVQTGKICSEETKLKLSIARRKRKMNPCSNETKRKIGEGQKNYQLKNPRLRNCKGQYISFNNMETNFG